MTVEVALTTPSVPSVDLHVDTQITVPTTAVHVYPTQMLHNTSSFDILIDLCIDPKSLDEHLSKHYLVAILTKLKSMGYVNIPSREAMRYIIA